MVYQIYDVTLIQTIFGTLKLQNVFYEYFKGQKQYLQ